MRSNSTVDVHDCVDAYNPRTLSAISYHIIFASPPHLLTIHDHGNLFAMFLGQDIVQQGRLPCAKISFKIP